MKSTTLSEAIRLKNQTIQDEKTLLNRIRLLEQEEQRTFRKIEETRKRTREIVQTRKEKETRHLYRNEWLMSREKDFLSRRETAQRIRSQRDRSYNTAHQYKREATQAFKRRLQEERNLRTANEARRLGTYKEKVLAIKREKVIGNERAYNFKMRKLEDCRNEYNRKLDEDLKFKAEKEKEIEEMEKIELELIKKLQQSEMVHQQAVDELEHITAKISHKFTDPYDN